MCFTWDRPIYVGVIAWISRKQLEVHVGVMNNPGRYSIRSLCFPISQFVGKSRVDLNMLTMVNSELSQAGDTRIYHINRWDTHKKLLQSWTLYKSADCRWISVAILCVSFTNSATVGRLEQVQLCNRWIDQSADNITGLKWAKECLILNY